MDWKKTVNYQKYMEVYKEVVFKPDAIFVTQKVKTRFPSLPRRTSTSTQNSCHPANAQTHTISTYAGKVPKLPHLSLLYRPPYRFEGIVKILHPITSNSTKETMTFGPLTYLLSTI